MGHANNLIASYRSTGLFTTMTYSHYFFMTVSNVFCLGSLRNHVGRPVLHDSMLYESFLHLLRYCLTTCQIMLKQPSFPGRFLVQKDKTCTIWSEE